MSRRSLPSGRLVLNTFRDQEGRPAFLEVFNPTRNTVEYLRYPDRQFYMTGGAALSEVEIPELIEHLLEEDQCFWRWPNPSNKSLILLPHAFPWCTPEMDDQLQDVRYRTVYTVRHVAPGRGGLPWNGTVLLDKPVDPSTRLSWIGEAASRNYIDFQEEDGDASTPTPGEDTAGDMGIAYPNVAKPTITYLLETQRPGSIGSKPFGSSTEAKPRSREVLQDPLAPQHSITIYGQWMDNLFRFLCLHPRTVVATRLARWFKGFMERNRPSLKFNGLPEILFWSQDASRRSRRDDEAAVREVRYYFRTEELEVHRESTLRDIGFNVSLSPTMQADPRHDWKLDPFTGSLYDESGNYLFGDLNIADTRQTGAA